MYLRIDYYMKSNKGPRLLLAENNIFSSLLYTGSSLQPSAGYLKKTYFIPKLAPAAIRWVQTIVWKIWYMTTCIVTSRGKCLS